MQLISHSGLATWLDHLAQETTLIAPRNVDGVLLYRPVQSSGDIVWDFVRPVLSVKEAFFPATERVLTIEKTGQQIRLNETVPDGERVIFGVRSCDARGFLAMDALFANTEPVDVYYTTRRENTALIGLSCNEMGETCFCTSTGGAPDDPTGMDLMLTEVDDGYAIQVITEKGAALLPEITLQELAGEIPQPVLNDPVPFPPMEAWPPQFNDAYWADMAERCLSCRICAYVCPTCRCFDVRDEPLPAENGSQHFERIRCWDSCAGEVYRQIAGGHNPRAAKGDRMRNRFFCKFYYYPEQYGPVACTGCGRCVDACPVNIDITEVMHAVQRLAEVEP
ncbi:MAG: sulfite reductase [Chloroflexi bacterium]|nr:sulfite reductase [Chloroflexota bacterium]